MFRRYELSQANTEKVLNYHIHSTNLNIASGICLMKCKISISLKVCKLVYNVMDEIAEKHKRLDLFPYFSDGN